ncbi:MAG TPA: hypothetical protein VJU84_20045 [Pyrinomonadaceae bacterium]|nr:hypothetical protein [Pyrinomonadaceae bacterium]
MSAKLRREQATLPDPETFNPELNIESRPTAMLISAFNLQHHDMI